MSRIAVAGLLLALGACGPEVALDQDLVEPAESALSGTPQTPLSRTIHLPTGVDMHFVEQGRAHGEPIIFLHGYTDSHHSFDLNLPLIPPRFHVFALDQRGHGLSSRPACCYATSDFVDDVVAFMDEMGIRKATLVGHSMGSFIAHGVAARYPTRVKHLVLIGSAPTVKGNPVIEGLAEWVDTFADPISQQDVFDFQASTFYRPVPASYLDTMVQQSLLLPADLWKQALHGLMADDHSAELGEIRAKTLVLWGDQDGLVSRADQQGLVDGIRHARLIVYEQTGHGLHAEQPERFVRDLLGFLR